VTLKKELAKRLPQWLDVPPDRDWLNRFCLFGNRVCTFREQHPCSQQWGQQALHCHIADGLDKKHPNYCQSEYDEIRGVFEEVLERYSDLEFSYLDERSLLDGYEFLLCSHCQTVRSTPFAIYRITSTTAAEVFVSIGINIALEKLFDYKIPKILLVRQAKNLPSLLQGYEVVEVMSTNDIKHKLKSFLPKVMATVRATAWRPRPLPFVEIKVSLENQFDVFVPNPEHETVEELLYQIPIEELQLSVRSYNSLKKFKINLVGELLEYSPDSLLEIQGLGLKSRDEVRNAVKDRLGINWTQSLTQDNLRGIRLDSLPLESSDERSLNEEEESPERVFVNEY
jgi:Bacterial RNA polymerase, alpha chain C terminal domain